MDYRVGQVNMLATGRDMQTLDHGLELHTNGPLRGGGKGGGGRMIIYLSGRNS